jgi:hypothetical protein
MGRPVMGYPLAAVCHDAGCAPMQVMIEPMPDAAAKAALCAAIS